MTEAKETNFRVVKYSNEHIHVVEILLTTTKTYARLEGLFKSLNQGSRLSIDEQWSMNTDTHGNPENWQISGFSAENVWWSEENTYSVYEALCEALDNEVNGNDEWPESCDRAATLAQWGHV